MSRKVYIDNMPLEQALAMLMERLVAIDALGVEIETVHILEAQGRITAEPVWAAKSAPHYQASAMDGIAVRAADTFGASETSPVFLKKEQDFIEVDTGDPVPLEFDSVIMIEDVNYKDADTAEIIAPSTPWQHVRSVGEDVTAAQMMLPAGFPIGPYEIGAFLTAGVNRVKVAKRPKIGIIPTGTEMVEPGEETGLAGEITESNSRVLSGLSQAWGAEPLRFAIAVDDRETLKKAVKKASEQADIVIICSGSSAGREDFTADTIEELGDLLLHGLATRPGKPAILGMINGKPVIGVPGYPVSAALVFELFARPLISAKLGMCVPEPDTVQAKIARKIASNMGVDEFIHVNVGRVGDYYLAFPLNRGAGITTSLVKSDGMLVIPRGIEGYQPGSTVNIKLARPREVIDRTILTIGSHDMALDYLGNIMWKGNRLRLSSTNVGSMGGIMALKRHETHFAGIHLLDTATGDYNVSYLEKYLKGEKLLLINLVIREQGIIVKPGNPLAIKGIDDLIRPDVRFVNRQSGAGTRILLDYLLDQKGLAAAQVNGYQREEYSHLAVAAAVANNTADAALGIYASAHAMNLDFIPVAQEQYDLCILPDLLGADKLEALRRAVASSEFAQEVMAFGGYDLGLSGKIMWES
ncbi:MAG: molybdopterin biosynthesis protein [Candidatus Saccharibacteria bacterium]